MNAAIRAAMALVAVAAFGVSQPDPGIAAPAKGAVHTVVIEDMKFVPAMVTVAKGDTVVWVNKDLFPHTVTAANGRFDSREIPAGKSWKFVARAVGESGYLCTFHPTMKGVLVVKGN